jgi:hypothetical protein
MRRPFENKGNAATITIDRAPVYLKLKALPAKNLAVSLQPEIKVAPVAPHMVGNVLPNGNFEDLNGGLPLNWRMPGGDKVKVVEAAGNHFISITQKETPFDSRIFATLPLEVAWKTMRISARLKGVALKPGKEAWQKATILCVSWTRTTKNWAMLPRRHWTPTPIGKSSPLSSHFPPVPITSPSKWRILAPQASSPLTTSASCPIRSRKCAHFASCSA